MVAQSGDPASHHRHMTSSDIVGAGSDTSLTLQTQGQVRLVAATAAGGVRQLFGVGKPLALIAFLAASPGSRARRETLMDLLWADLEPEAARHALRQTLWFIKKRVGDDFLAIDGDQIALSRPLRVDRDQFLALLHSGDTARAVECYGGDFLPDFSAPGGAAFEQWADVERRRLRDAFAHAAETEIRRLLATARFREAQALARRLRDHDPQDERSWRLLLESLMAGRDRVTAAVEARALEQLLRVEEREAEPATRTFIRLARQVPSPPSGDEAALRALVPDLVGREREFSLVIVAWDDARQGNARHVHLVAPAGLGKTRLLSDLQSRIRATRGRVVATRGHIGTRDIPYALASDLAAGLATLPGARGISPNAATSLVAMHPTLSSAFPVAPDTSAGEDALRRRALSLRELIAAVAEEQPLALVVDDVHWADVWSQRLLTMVLVEEGRGRVLLVSASRPEGASFIRSEQTREIALAPLSVEAVTSLLVSLAQFPPHPWAEWFPADLCAAASGSPLLVLETLQYLLERQVLVIADDVWEAPNPVELRAMLRAGGSLRNRVRSIQPDLLRYLSTLALLGTPVDVGLLARAMGQSEGSATIALQELERRGFVVQASGSAFPAHDEIAAVALDLMPVAARRDAAQALGRALAEQCHANPTRCRQAAILLAEAGDEGTLRRVAAQFVRGARHAGDHRPLGVLVGELLGHAATPERVRRTRRGLPVGQRLGLHTRGRLAAAAAALLAPAVGAYLLLQDPVAPPPADARLLVGRALDSARTALFEVPLRLSEWTAGLPVLVEAKARPAYQIPVDVATGGIRDPRADRWIVGRVVPDSGTFDQFAVYADGRAERLTFDTGDDNTFAFSPDLRWAITPSAKWSWLSRFDLALRDSALRIVRQLTASDDSDITAVWSPDGTRIAWIRRYWVRGKTAELCTAHADGSRATCRQTAVTPRGLLAWSRHGLVLHATADTSSLLLQLDPDDLRYVVLARSLEEAVAADDGEWIACRCARPGFPKGPWYVFGLARPVEWRPLGFSDGSAEVAALQWQPAPRTTYVDTLVLSAGPGAPEAGLPHLITARPLDRLGRVTTADVLTWRSLDPGIATIDPVTGVLAPRRAGRATVEASAGGWRIATLAVAIAPPNDSVVVVLDETWAGPWTDRWQRYGRPSPSVDRGRDARRVLRTNGDQTGMSGVISRRPFEVEAGLAVDVEVSTPLTLPQWQNVIVALHAVAPSAPPGVDDPGEWYPWRDGSFPRACGMSFPADEGAAGLDSAAFFADRVRASVPVPARLQRGGWYTLRVQFFPDGRCGLALDGTPLVISAVCSGIAAPAWLELSGMSFSTEIAVSRVRIRRGVPRDIDWARAPSSRPARPSEPPL